jgi:hypothetical protein
MPDPGRVQDLAALVLRRQPMAGRGPQTYKKRQKEQQRKERQQEKAAKRLQRKQDKPNGVVTDSDNDEVNELDGTEAHDSEDAPVLHP